MAFRKCACPYAYVANVLTCLSLCLCLCLRSGKDQSYSIETWRMSTAFFLWVPQRKVMTVMT